jgi:hypothetical protein
LEALAWAVPQTLNLEQQVLPERLMVLQLSDSWYWLLLELQPAPVRPPSLCWDLLLLEAALSLLHRQRPLQPLLREDTLPSQTHQASLMLRHFPDHFA